MNITSLLQEVPSIDRTRRKPWEDTVTSAKAASDVHAPSEPLGREIERIVLQDTSRTLQTTPGYGHLSPSLGSYLLQRSERENDKVGLPPLVQPDYGSMGSVETAHGAARIRRDQFLTQHTPGAGQPSFSDDTRPLEANSPLSLKHQLDDSNRQRISNVPLLPPPRTPSPALDPVHLGSYVYPNLPFPIRRSLLRYNQRTTVNILVPSSHFPLGTVGVDPRARSLWGGVPYVDERKIYTDDSDVLFAALHAGVVDLTELQKDSGRDLDLCLRVFPASEYGRYAGGPGAAGLTSASWGNSHEGAAFMITSHSWIQGNVKKTYTRQTRKARIAEENCRRVAIMGSSDQSFVLSLKPKPAVSPSLGSLPIKLERSALEEELQAISVTGLWQNASGIKYDPLTFYLLLFHKNESTEEQSTAKSNKYAPYTKRVRSIRYNPDIVLEHSNRPLERLVLVATSPEKTAQTTPMTYNLYREEPPAKTERPPETLPLKPSLKEVPTENATLTKSIRFAEAPLTKGEPLRHLVHENLGAQDIAFVPEGLSINGILYPVERWRWSENRLEPPAPLVPPKPRSLKKKSKRKSKTRREKKVSTQPVENTTAAIDAQGTSDMQVDVPDTADESSSKDAAATQNGTRDEGEPSVVSVEPTKETLPADHAADGEEREEGELSG